MFWLTWPSLGNTQYKNACGKILETRALKQEIKSNF
jgi:hypothetical protein